MFNYLRADNVWKKFKSINDKIRDEMDRAAKRHSEVNPDKWDNDLLDCWDAWIEARFDKMTADGRDWVTQAISDMKNVWDPDKYEGRPDMVRLCQSIQAQLTVLGTKAAKAINREYFDLGHGAPMDTSD